MRPRFRRPEPMATFELVPDDERDDDAHPVPAGAGGDDDVGARRGVVAVRERAAGRWRRLSRRGHVAVAAGTAVVVLAAATAAVTPGLLDARDQRVRAEAVQGMPGVVGDLSEPVTPTWTLPPTSAVAAALPDGVLVLGDGTSVSAVDAATGGTLWEHRFDDGAQCGPTPWSAADWARPSETVVCVGSDGTTVTVLDPSGEVVGERQLDASADADLEVSMFWPLAMPAAAGAVAMLDGGSSAVSVPWQEGDDAAHTLRALHDAGWSDPTLRVEDALTGEVRAEVTIRLTAEDVDGCGVAEDGLGGSGIDVQPWIDALPWATTLSLCGITRAVTPSGDVIDVGDGSRMLSATTDGGYVLQGETSDLLDEHGATRTTIDGWAPPLVVDTAPDGPVLAMLGSAGEGSAALAAVGDDGEPVWTHWLTSVTELARVGDTVVVTGEDTITALDAATGEERWRLEDAIDADPEHGEYVVGVATDGTRLLLALASSVMDAETGETRSGHRLVALDLRDGSTAWERPGEGDLWGLSSVGGHLVATGERVGGLG
ncbi:PQQ-binding-like beta-propeller repeat protein [Promicromonospora sp. Marseille-Q5078]